MKIFINAKLNIYDRVKLLGFLPEIFEIILPIFTCNQILER